MKSNLLASLLLLPIWASAIEKVIPEGGGHGSNWRSNGMCGRRVGGWILQVDVEDESIAIPGIVDAILKAHPLQLVPGCSFIGGWRGGITQDVDLEFRITRWIPESSIEPLIKKISSYGTVRYLNELQSQGTFDESLVKEYKRAQSRWKDDPKLEWDPVEKRIVREQIQYLAPKARSYEETVDKVPLHVVVVRKHGLKDLGQGPSPDGVSDYGEQPTWLGVERRLKDGSVEDRRKAAFRLTKLAPATFGDSDIGGIGLVLGTNSSGTVVVANIDPESPLRDKVSRGDAVKLIDDKPVGGLAEAVNSLRGKSDQSVSIEFLKSGGNKERIKVRRLIIFPSAKRFEETVWRAAHDEDSLVAELAIRASRSPNIDHDKSVESLERLVGQKAQRVRLAAIQALQFALWNGTPN